MLPCAVLFPANELSCPKFNTPLKDELVVAEPSPVRIVPGKDGVPAALLPVAGLPEFCQVLFILNHAPDELIATPIISPAVQAEP